MKFSKNDSKTTLSNYKPISISLVYRRMTSYCFLKFQQTLIEYCKKVFFSNIPETMYQNLKLFLQANRRISVIVSGHSSSLYSINVGIFHLFNLKLITNLRIAKPPSNVELSSSTMCPKILEVFDWRAKNIVHFTYLRRIHIHYSTKYPKTSIQWS